VCLQCRALRCMATFHVSVQEDMASNIQVLCRMPSLQQLSLDVGRLIQGVVMVPGTQYLCELETMTALTQLHLSIRETGFSGAFGGRACAQIAASVLTSVLMASIISRYQCWKC
jgi:hypothetical protein